MSAIGRFIKRNVHKVTDPARLKQYGWVKSQADGTNTLWIDPTTKLVWPQHSAIMICNKRDRVVK